MENSKKLAVFDLDGTLSQTDLFSVPAHLETMKEMGYPVLSPEEIKRTYGMVQSDYLNALIGDSESEKAMKYLRRVAALEDEFVLTKGKPYDGIAEMLKGLKAEGVETAVCSNASLRYITMVLKAYNIYEFIDYIQPITIGLSKIDTLGILLENTKPTSAVMVGDTGYDRKAAEMNNIPFIGCLYGFRPEEVKGEYAVETADMLLDTINTVLGKN